MSPAVPAEAAAFLDDWLGLGWHAAPLSGDASVRGYFRLSSPSGGYMLAYYPPAVRADVERFVRAHDAIAAHARVPAVVRHSEFAVAQVDVGDQSLYEILLRDREAAMPYYRAAVDLIAEFQQAPEAARGINPPFDAVKFGEELEMTARFYVDELMGEGEAAAALRPLFARLIERVTGHPYVLCHRDYHGQNLHVHGGLLYMIDYQDLRMGPDSYDLASLLRDRGVARIIGRETEEALIDYYRARIGADGELRRRYFEALFQRTLKTIGTFASQSILRGRHHYLAFIPPSLETLRDCVAVLPEYRDVLDLFPMRFTDEDARRIERQAR